MPQGYGAERTRRSQTESSYVATPASFVGVRLVLIVEVLMNRVRFKRFDVLCTDMTFMCMRYVENICFEMNSIVLSSMNISDICQLYF